MRYLLTTLTVIAAGFVALPAMAQPPDGERGGRLRDPEMRQRMLDEFDQDGDGRLSDEERQAMRDATEGPARAPISSGLMSRCD